MSYTVIPQENTNILLDAGELLSSHTPLKLNILTPDDIVGVLSAAAYVALPAVHHNISDIYS